MDSLTTGALAQASTLAFALIISSQAPVVLLDDELAVVVASATFYRDFNLQRPLAATREAFAGLGAGEWNVPQLLRLLQATADGYPQIETYEMDLSRPGEPDRQLVISAHKLDYEGAALRVVLAITDVTAIRLADRLKNNLLREKQLLMQELQHRVANSLQIIASVLLQSARKVNSDETRWHLSDAHNRVMSVATLQHQLATSQEGEMPLKGYFKDLCDSISASMIADCSNLTLSADIDDSIVDARMSVSLGLIVTELVINSLKHAYPNNTRSGKIRVSFRSTGPGWILTVDDDGIGFPKDPADVKPGLGTGIVEALAAQLEAAVSITDNHPGARVSVTRA